MKKSNYLFLMLLFLSHAILVAQTDCITNTFMCPEPVEVITDDDLLPGGTYDWMPNTHYLLDGYVVLEEGATLNIAAGTVIRALQCPSNTSQITTVLIVARGATININGTNAGPVIFTSEFDHICQFPQFPTPNLQSNAPDQGLWGGIMVLGGAEVGVSQTDARIEGITLVNDPERLNYGEVDLNLDGEPDVEFPNSSGTFHEVNVRYAGQPNEQGDPISGWTFAGVGAATDIFDITSYRGAGDAYTFKGGETNGEHINASLSSRHSFVFEECWSGGGVDWHSVQPEGSQFDAVLVDNCSNEIMLEPERQRAPERLRVPVLSNLTLIGGGAQRGNENNNAFRFRNGGALKVFNSIITDFGGRAIVIEENDGERDSYDRFLSDQILFSHNIFFNFGPNGGPGQTFQQIVDTEGQGDDQLVEALRGNSNNIVDPQLGDVSRVKGSKEYDPRPLSGGPADTLGVFPSISIPTDPGQSIPDYRGAFSCENYWILEWTTLFTADYLNESPCVSASYSFTQNEFGVKLYPFYPNPGGRIILAKYDLPASSEIRVEVYNISGALHEKFDYGVRAAGENLLQVNAGGYLSGLYVAALITEFGTVTQKFMIVGW